MQQAKRHHFVPKAYLKSFCDTDGKLLIYRKDDPSNPLHVKPDATQFRRYYYSQPIPGGGQDNNTLEGLFSAIESSWPETVVRLHQREDVNDRLINIFEFMSLQRVRVPAARDLVEATLAQSVKDTVRVLLANGTLPPPPPGLENIAELVQVSIDPHQSIHAMADMLKGMSSLYDRLGFAAIHNTTDRRLLTSDNPVLWFDPAVPFTEQRPYTIDPDGPIALLFPVSPKLIIVGSTEYRETFGQHGLLHSSADDEATIEAMNRQICRFAYEAVIATDTGHEEMILEFADVSPVLETTKTKTADGLLTLAQQSFGRRLAKPKWNPT
ncbi:DUF4238 domain-containing protein [Burkholderia sp. BE17]|uniref:DUF4238 domain-containing protein n=1 Tax=Burkholderia sp. BE17 TaxID=2656644 RepID=UPI00128B192C|nr:DUF4238 domain-containing protein [Burkholderia sp. BE17]MPV65831.1 DUF4238 domain-containing protein [Burkholderia sp. BE17]